MKTNSSIKAAEPVPVESPEMAPKPIKARELTKRQRLFVVSYLKHYNASKAALEAGYSQKTAYSIGHENKRKPAIKALIDAGLALERAEADRRLEERRNHGYARR